MQTKPLMWDDYYNSINKTIEYKAVIGTDEYLNANLYSVTVTGGLCTDDVFSLGNVICRKLDLSIIPKETAIPKMANVDLYMRYNGANGPTDWLPKGKYFIDTRQKAKGRLNLECYDSVMKMEKPFIQDGNIPDFPMLMTDALNVICTRLGIVLDNPGAISSTLYIEYPNELTMRQVAGYIASANGGNFIITDEGKLRLVVPAIDTPIESISYKTFDEINDVWTLSRVTMYYDDESYFTAGDDTGEELIIDNIWATQAICNHILSLLSGYTHKPFTCTGAYINPAAELGDTVTIGTFTGIIFTATIHLGAVSIWDIGSPGETALEHEYPYEGSYARAIKQKVSLNTSYYGVTIDRANGIVVEKSDGISKAIFNSDKIEVSISDVPVFQILNGKLHGKITLDAGSELDWEVVDPPIPTAEQVGARPDTWMPTAADVGALATNWVGATHIDAYGLYTGSISANQITAGTISGNIVNGGTVNVDYLVLSNNLTAYGYVDVSGALSANSIESMSNIFTVTLEGYLSQITFKNTACQLDYASGHMRLKASDSVYLRVNSGGSFDFVSGGSTVASVTASGQFTGSMSGTATAVFA